MRRPLRSLTAVDRASQAFEARHNAHYRYSVAALARWPERVSSALARIEVVRALRRARLPQSAFGRADQVLSAIALVHVDELVLRAASTLRLPSLRSLEAIHLATAQSIGDLPDAFITYDDRLTAAARTLGLPVQAPGMPSAQRPTPSA